MKPSHFRNFDKDYNSNNNNNNNIHDTSGNIRMRSFTFTGFNTQQQHQPPSAQNGSIIIDVPLVTVNNLIIRCKHEKGRYLPLEILSYQQIVGYLRKTSYKEYALRNKLTQIVSVGPSSRESKVKDDTSSTEKDPKDSIPHPHPWNRKQRNSTATSPVGTNHPTIKLPPARSVLLELSQENNKERECFLRTGASTETTSSEKERQYETQMKWVGMQDKHDYVAMEKLKTTEDFEVLLRVLMNCKSPTLVQIKLNKDDSFTVIYQFIEDFRQEYMLLMIGTKYCLFLEPF